MGRPRDKVSRTPSVTAGYPGARGHPPRARGRGGPRARGGCRGGGHGGGHRRRARGGGHPTPCSSGRRPRRPPQIQRAAPISPGSRRWGPPPRLPSLPRA